MWVSESERTSCSERMIGAGIDWHGAFLYAAFPGHLQVSLQEYRTTAALGCAEISMLLTTTPGLCAES